MTSEESFHDRIEDELAGLHPPPIGEIAGDALAQGRRIRRRERALGMAGGTAAVAGVAAGVLALGGVFGSGRGGVPVGPGALGGAPTSQQSSTPAPSPTASSAHTSTSTSTPSPSPTPTPPSSSSPSSSSPNTVIGTIPASWKPPTVGGRLNDPRNTDGQSVAELLIEDLGQIGPGSGSSFSGSSMSGQNANATMTWTTQHGSIRISASVSNDGVDGKTPQSVCYPGFEIDYCAAATLSDGSVVMVVHGTGEPPAGSPPTHDNTVMITRPDHLLINVVEWSNGPLTDDQLYKIVADPRWGLKMNSSFVAHADAVVRPFSGD